MITAVDCFSGAEDPCWAGIVSLWQTAFGDEESYIRNFLLHCPKRAYLEHDGQNVNAMLFVLPSKLRLGGAEYETGYIYAAATAPSKRGQGLMSTLVRHAHEDMRQLPYFALLPASRSLYDFYAKLDYKAVFYRKTVILSRGQLEEAAAGALPARTGAFDFTRFAQLRSSLSDPALLWGDDALRYVLGEYSNQGGRVVMFEGGYLLCMKQNDSLLVNELCLPYGGFRETAAWLVSEYPCDRFEFRQQPCSTPQGETKPYGMLWARQGSPEAGREIYFNLGLD